MEVTNKMVHAAVRQLVKDTYTHYYESVKRMIEKAIEKEGQEF